MSTYLRSHVGKRLAVVVGALLFWAGCAEQPGPIIGTFVLSLTDGVPSQGSDVRVALIWASSGDNRGFVIADDVEATIGGTFDFEVRQLISAHSLRLDDDDDGPKARGGFVVYDDVDGDGQLDLTPVSADRFQDRVLGWAPGMRVIVTPDPSELSDYERGFNLERQTIVDAETTLVEVLAVDTVVELRLFDSEASACLGITPLVRSLPRAISKELSALTPQPAIWWPHPLVASDCADNEVPSDWFRITCDAEPDAYIVTVLRWPASEAIADMCGWSASYCRVRLRDGEQRPLEFPICAAL